MYISARPGDSGRQFLQEEVSSKIDRRIVVLIYDVDTTLSLSFSDDFFAEMRAMYHALDNAPELRRLSFILIGVATPPDLIDDPRRTPFNIGEFVELNDFTFDESGLLLKVAEGFGLTDAEARKVLAWSPDGMTPASGSFDTTTILWRAAMDAEVLEHTPPHKWERVGDAQEAKAR